MLRERFNSLEPANKFNCLIISELKSFHVEFSFEFPLRTDSTTVIVEVLPFYFKTSTPRSVLPRMIDADGKRVSFNVPYQEINFLTRHCSSE